MSEKLRAEFDLLADEYAAQHAQNIAVTGESPDYFAEYKIADLSALVQARGLAAGKIVDFGCGIGNAVPFFRKYFAASELVCADVSARSIEIAQTRFGGAEHYALVGDDIPLATASQDIVYSACVFHHIPAEAHAHWLGELRRIAKPGGLLVIYEHNPLNPLTVRAVNTCPFDANAKLIKAGVLRARVAASGWAEAGVAFKVFFPAALKALRPLEPRLGWLPLGAQYRVAARCP